MIQVFDNLSQGTAEWFKVRAGIPTASRFHDIMKMRKRGEGKGGPTELRRAYLLELAGERLTEETVESYSGGALARGHVMEDDARRLYAFMTDTAPQKVGFVLNTLWRAGASPDSGVPPFGALEIKSKLPKFHLECLEEDAVPEEHIAQCQGVMGIWGREWIDFVSYWPKLPLFVKRLERDEHYIATMKIAVQEFNEELDALVEKYQTKEAA